VKAGSGHIAVVLLAGTAFGLLALEPGPTPKPKSPSESERIKTLPEEERQWLTEFAAPIILEEEKKAFLELEAPYQREVFKREFWERRELPDLLFPLGPGYRFRYQELRQLADEKYDGWRQDAGRMVLRWGEPASILKPRCVGEDVFDVEVWTYDNLGRSGRTAARYIFYRRFGGGPRRLWTLNDGARQVFYPNSCRRSFSDLAGDCPPPSLSPCAECEDRCQVYRAYQEISARQGSGAGAAIEQATLFEPPRVSTEGLDRQKNRWATSSDPGAKKILVEGPSSVADGVFTSPIPFPTPTPEPRHRLSAEEIRERILRLEPKYREWLDIAGPLMTEEELSRFLQSSAAEKDRFIREFWKRHS
jgi:GWxTD domain-containing protein